MHDTNAYMHTNVYVGLHELFHMYVYLDRCIHVRVDYIRNVGIMIIIMSIRVCLSLCIPICLS